MPDLIVYEDVLTYPATLQDIAVAVDEDVEVGALVDAAHEAAGELLREARVFDVYRGEQVGEGRKSVAIHLAFQSPERTLTEEEATAARDAIVAALGRALRRRAARVAQSDRPPRDVERGDDSVPGLVRRSRAVVGLLVASGGQATRGQSTTLHGRVGPGSRSR